MCKFVLWVLLGFLPAMASVMADSLHEAVFMFEMQGRFAKAKQQLEHIANSKEATVEERTQAKFYLGKIAELSGSDKEALQHYTAAQRGNHVPAVAYWLADRNAKLDPRPETLLRGILQLPAKPLQTTTGNNPGVLLDNQQYWTVQRGHLSPARQQAPMGSQVHTVDAKGLWYSDAEQPNSLYFQSFRSKSQVRHFELDAPTQSVTPISNFQTVVNTNRSLYWLAADRIQWKVELRYAGCQILGLYSPTKSLALNCSDNALHFLNQNDGSERQNIALIDNIDKALLTNDGILISSAGTVWYFQPHLQTEPIWRYTGGIVQDFNLQGNRITILGADGSLTLVQQKSGLILARTRSDGERLANLGTGLLGTLTDDGLLTAYDTLLTPLWNYHFASGLQVPPFVANDALYFPLRNGKVMVLASNVYGKRPSIIQKMEERAHVLADSGDWQKVKPLVDSLLKMENGNPSAWYLKAQYLSMEKASRESSRAWSNAAVYARSDPEFGAKVLKSYAREIGAHFVQYLDVSPHTLYPRIFGDSRSLYIFDAASRRLQSLSPQQGLMRWSIPLNQLEQNPVLSHDSRYLAVGSGFQVEVVDLAQKGKTRAIELPGKTFQLHQNSEALYVTTWNGFLLKFLKSNWQLAWSRKLFTTPAFIAETSSGLHLLNQAGEIQHVSTQSPQSTPSVNSALANPAFFRGMDAYLVGTNQEDLVQTRKDTLGYPIVSAFHTGSQILAMELVDIQGEPHGIFGLANQQLAFFNLKSGKEVWRFQGKGSVFMQPSVQNGVAWLDQKDEIVAIQLETGKILARQRIIGDSGPPFVTGDFLYSSSPRRLLYSFPVMH